jgi:hypothetical protein
VGSGDVEMYEKRLFSKEVLFFRYAPPFTKLDATVDRPKDPYPNPDPWHCSVYYYWWAFLRESEAYRQCCENSGSGKLASLYRDFGDIHANDFPTWWVNGGRNLFCEREGERVEPYEGDYRDHDHERRVLISVPVRKNLDRTVAELRALLQHLLPNRIGSNGNSTAKYVVETKPVLSSLHKILTVHRLVQENKHLTQHQIADLFGYKISGGGGANDPDVKQRKSIWVAQHVKKAATLIANVERGMFPVTTDTPNLK